MGLLSERFGTVTATVSPKNRIPLRRKGTRRLRAAEDTREQFNAVQEALFSREEEVDRLRKKEPPIIQRLHEIVQSAFPLPESPRVIDVGCGIGCLVPHFHEADIEDILCVDLSEPMLIALQEKYPASPIEGNSSGVRVWNGDFVDLPNYMGPVDAVFFNAVFGNLYSMRDALTKSVSLLLPQGKIVVSHPLGRKWHCKLRGRSPETVPHALPTLGDWQDLLADIPLTVIDYREKDKLYIAALQVPDGYTFPGSPIFVQGEVILGRGIGSAKLGVPTANLSPESFQEQLKGQPKGVYFGWAQLTGRDSNEVHRAVFNLGNCPTMKGDQAEISLEAHVLHKFEESFYGETLRVALLGFLRPEMKFSGVSELLKQIRTDIGIAKNQLKSEKRLAVQQDSFFDSS